VTPILKTSFFREVVKYLVREVVKDPVECAAVA